MNIKQYAIMVGIIIAAVLIVDVFKYIVEALRKKIGGVTEKEVEITDENGQTSKKIIYVYADGKEYKKLTFIYQLIAFILSCGGIFAYLYCSVKTQFAESAIWAILIGSGEAKAYEVLETFGKNGIFAAVLVLINWVKSKFAKSTNGQPITDQIQEAAEDFSNIVSGSLQEIADAVGIEDDVAEQMAKITGKSADACKNLLEYFKNKNE